MHWIGLSITYSIIDGERSSLTIHLSKILSKMVTESVDLTLSLIQLQRFAP